MIRSSEIKLHNRETAIEVTGAARTPGGFMHLLPPIPNVEDYKGSNRAITTCWLHLQTVGIVDIQQVLANLDTMSTLVSDTLVSHAEPPPSGWTDITLEQTYKY